MTFLKRLRMLSVVLGVVATLATVGTVLFGDVRADSGPAKTPGAPPRPDGASVVEDLAINKFSKLPVLTYQMRDGDMLFAWQIKPTVNPTPARPRDVLVLVDTSASQAGRPLQQARRIVASLSSALTPNDRVSVWTVNTPAATRPLTKSFHPANAEEIQHAAAALTEVEYGSGATDLKSGLDKALATLVPDRSRQQIVLLLGDGESSFNPVSEDDRFAIGSRMDVQDAFFFAVPLGLKVNPQNLHGLAALTGGAVVRVQEDLDNPVKRGEFMIRLAAAFDVPVVKVEKAKFGDEVGEVFPSKLPPLRADRSTLVMGKIAKPAATTLALTVKGTVANRVTNLDFSQPLPVPQIDHFFLNLMIDQWRGAPHKDAPAMLQSDRALALASTQVKLYRDEFLVQAVWAVRMDRWEDATKLYNAAQKIDPNDREATAGLLMIEKLKTGKLTKADIEQKISADASGIRVAPNAIAQKVIQNIKQDPPPAGGPGGAAGAAGGVPPAGDDIIKQAEAKRQIEEQRYKVLTDETIRQARRLLRSDPDSAYQELKRQREEILSYDGIGNGPRTQMAADLESVMREIFTKGAEIKRQAEAERAAIGRTRQRLNEFDKAQDEQARLKNRIDQFHQLMQQARFEQAYQESQLMIQERVSKGQSVPVTVTASYVIGQQATQLREWKELVRIREDRFLLSMMQTEKAHIPYPDEPPVHFPPASVWRELTSLRREAYLNQNLGNKPTQAQIELRDKIENSEVPVIEGNINDMSLIDLLTFISKKSNVTFVIMDEYFKADGGMEIKEKKPTVSSTKLNGLKLGTFLDLVLATLGATFIVRPDYVEITTYQRRLEEKVTRVFPVADLVIPIPSTVSQQNLQQNISVQNQQLAIFGAVLGAQNFLGGGGMQFGGGQFGGQQFGGQQQFGAPGAQLGQQNIGQQNMIGNQNNNNGGFGGGQLSIGGGQLGQFGNLGGQFGLQGGDQSKLLTNLIVETVAKGEWSNVPPPRPQPGGDVEETIVPTKQLNSLGYYPPARAHIVRGTSRYHPQTTVKLKKDEGQAAGPANPRAPGGPVVISPDGPDPVKQNPNNPVAVANAADGGAEKPKMVDPNADPVALKKQLSRDPKRMWSEAIDWTITDPGVIVACAEFLMDMREYSSAVEILKGGMRKGLTTDSWAHESLAIALQMSQGSPVEVERAALSAID
ncbi:MAG TPA: VWA domain-containing protein, partial [Gemmata sp.]|nr:VWA domain-containing protein [Gemmata sp.]